MRAMLFWLLPLAVADGASWTEYTGCELEEGAYIDGDSFNGVRGLRDGASRTSKINWRLYGVDCPETDTRQPERVKEQAKAFRVPEGEVLKWGKEAARFTEKFLSKPFTVHTRREKAGGASAKNRYFAIVVGHDGRLLHEALLETGLARAYGWNAEWPPGTSAERFASKLKSLERAARARKAGIWGSSAP